MPTTNSSARTNVAQRSMTGAASINAPPSANSQARIGIRKKAAGGSVVVTRTLTANVVIPTSSSAVNSTRMKTPQRLRDTSISAISNVGQTR
jgi:hypothetical protein